VTAAGARAESRAAVAEAAVRELKTRLGDAVRAIEELSGKYAGAEQAAGESRRAAERMRLRASDAERRASLLEAELDVTRRRSRHNVSRIAARSERLVSDARRSAERREEEAAAAIGPGSDAETRGSETAGAGARRPGSPARRPAPRSPDGRGRRVGWRLGRDAPLTGPVPSRRRRPGLPLTQAGPASLGWSPPPERHAAAAAGPAAGRWGPGEMGGDDGDEASGLDGLSASGSGLGLPMTSPSAPRRRRVASLSSPSRAAAGHRDPGSEEDDADLTARLSAAVS